MATAEHVKSLILAYLDHNDLKFKTVVLQIAAYEARQGHDNIARELKKYADKISSTQNIIFLNKNNTLLKMDSPNYRLSELIVSDDIMGHIKRILLEYRNRRKLRDNGLTNRRKILIEGKPGTGKTFTASVIASELELPLYTVMMDKIFTKFMGETSAKLREVFDEVANSRGVYFFDEFDAIGADRSYDNEVGEMRRVLNSFLQFLDQDASDSIIIAATNNQKLLDEALFRRFDDVLHYELPTRNEIIRLVDFELSLISPGFTVSDDVISACEGLSQAEIIKVCDDATKMSLLENIKITSSILIKLLNERKSAYTSREA